MKKIFLLLLLCLTIINISSCSNDEYTSKYDNPSQTSKASCEKLMTGVFIAGKTYTFNSYWRMYTWDNGVIGRYAQTVGFTNAEGTIYSANDSYANSRWENFYDVLTQFRTLQSVYEKLDDKDKNVYKVFYFLSEIYVYDHLSQLIDAFGDVPFEKAGFLSINGDVAQSYPSYDEATSLYSMMLDRLGVLSSELTSLNGNLDNLAAAFLPSQDFINGGNLSLWIKYCNSLRLRLAMRVASQGELANKGKQVVAEILNGNLSIVSNISENIDVIPDSDGFNYADEFRDGYKDHSYASQEILNVLGSEDPRLPIMYSKNAQGQYRGLSTHETYAEQQVNVSLKESERVYSRIDSTTVIYNKHLISPIITASEVDFMRAEAYQKGWASGSAKDAFKSGVLHSTQFYFNLNKISESSYGTKLEIPAENDILVYAEKIWDAEANKEKLIISQKWLNFGFIQPSLAWSETRRTGYPELFYPADATAQQLKNIPNRVRYPSSERNKNIINYNNQISKMGGVDDAYLKLFWAK